jgi:protein-S-isoprenylcysteine O-methyltransferase Ste14
MGFLRQEFALLGYFLAYFLLAFVWRSVLVFRRTGVNPFLLPKNDDAHGYVGRAFRFVVAGYGVVVVANLFSGSEKWLRHYAPVDASLAVLAGWTLLLASLVWLLIAQAQMGSSWRIGIDSQHRTDLIRSGLFGLSRNPIFLAMRLNLLGFFLVLPCAATLALWVAGELLIQIQVRLEEQHLSSLHGLEYVAYCRNTRRWI